MPRRQSLDSRPTSLGPTSSRPLAVSIPEWLERVEPYVERDPRKGQITGIRLAADEVNDDRAVSAMCAAGLLLKATAVFDEMTVEDALISQHSRREFWRMWAQDELAHAGFTAPDDQTLLDLAKGTDLRALRFAANLEFACRRLEASDDPNERAFLMQQASRLIDTALNIEARERLLPQAQKGIEARARLSRGGKRAAKAREEKLGRAGWRTRVRQLDSMMDEPEDRKGRAEVIRKKVGLAWRTVYDALPGRRSRKSSR